MSFGELRTARSGYLHEADVYLMAAIDLLPPKYGKPCPRWKWSRSATTCAT